MSSSKGINHHLTMKPVQYSRILYLRSSILHLFIRESRVIVSTVLFLALYSAHFAVAEADQKAAINLQTCCPFQSQYNADDGTCESVSTKDDVKFPETLNLPAHLISRVYRNMTRSQAFRLKQNLISCPNGTIAVNVSLSLPDYDPLEKQKFSPILFTPVNGYLRHNFDIYYPDEYCFDKIDENALQIRICQSDCSAERPCVPKCCDVGQVWDLSEYPDGPAKCAASGEMLWAPKIYSRVKDKIPLDNVRPHIILSHPRFWCEDESVIHRLKPFMDEKERQFRILQSGEVWYKFDRLKWAPFTKGTYCVDGHFVNSESGTGHYSGNYDDTIVWDCGPPLITPKTIGTSQLYGISMVIAAFFLLITVIVYILLWDKQNVHGWTLLCYFTSLFFMYIVYSAVHFTSLSLEQDAVYGGGTVCYIIGVCAHFFFLSSFCFMSAVNFDLWWTFRALMPTGGKSKGLKKFLAYILFSLGIPTIIVAVGVTLDTLYRDDPDSTIIVPEYGKKTCYLDREYATFPYMHGPAGFLLTCNLIFFTVTVYAMYKIHQSTKFATRNSSKNAKQKQSVVLFAKLVLVMGLPWVFEVISSTVQQGIEVPWYFQVLDMINILQAVAIFIIFVLKTDIRNSLENKYPLFRPKAKRSATLEPSDLTKETKEAEAGFILAITLRPEQADSILRRHPRLRFIINPLTRSITSTRSFSTAKTTLSTGTEGSTSSRANVLRRDSEALDRSLSSSTTSSSTRSSPSGSLSGKRSEKQKVPEILELR